MARLKINYALKTISDKTEATYIEHLSRKIANFASANPLGVCRHT